MTAGTALGRPGRHRHAGMATCTGGKSMALPEAETVNRTRKQRHSSWNPTSGRGTEGFLGGQGLPWSITGRVEVLLSSVTLGQCVEKCLDYISKIKLCF